eukprot:jgi/Tetstr1/453304/TSEL_040296.t1
MEINRTEKQQKAAGGAALDAPRGGKTQLPKIRTAIAAEQIAGTRLPLAARPRPTADQRPQRREEQAPHETISTANMNINKSEEHHAAEVGATIDAPRSGRAEPLKSPATIAAKNVTYTRLPPAVRRHLRVSSRQSRQPPIDLSLDTDCATQVALLFSNLATRNRATGVDLRRSRVFQNPIRALGPKLGVYTSTHDVQAVTRRAPKPAAAATEGVSGAGLATNTGSDAKLVAASITPLYGREKIATAHQPAPPTADQSAMHHGQLPQELQPPPTTEPQAAHAPAAAAPQATEMDSDDSPPAVEQPATSVDPAPQPEPAPPAAAQAPTATREASEATNPSGIPPQPAHQPRRPAWPNSRQRLIAPAAPRAGRPLCSRRSCASLPGTLRGVWRGGLLASTPGALGRAGRVALAALRAALAAGGGHLGSHHLEAYYVNMLTWHWELPHVVDSPLFDKNTDGERRVETILDVAGRIRFMHAVHKAWENRDGGPALS